MNLGRARLRPEDLPDIRERDVHAAGCLGRESGLGTSLRDDHFASAVSTSLTQYEVPTGMTSSLKS